MLARLAHRTLCRPRKIGRSQSSARWTPQPTPTVNWGSGECVDVGTKLWDSWEDDALVANPEAPVCQTSGRRESAHALS
ncbi:MAG: hypothetical protein E5V74_09905 [Mesorhizobium sp.]|nr:MAG: hypothetical protein EOS64_23095 [Mesorhizobium sp.]TGS85133.1 hypothetical protein EN818_21975 [Mesorhizobium sp. M3A.F.Ca.ET.175.01.1.1]TGT23122.1 hypothetical protein EN817_23890 [Mesorhizobium sp. M3A.F.Ca.ET.174.01.1.1]TIU13540.1 MAG: hypothetical protein E5W44_03010 [Mesorhizobium sp.]TIW03144.1 MAG: hypothetical protein E5V74_09905 [Mesorhizobium sp.]